MSIRLNFVLTIFVGIFGISFAQNDLQCFVEGQCYEGDSVFAQGASKFIKFR